VSILDLNKVYAFLTQLRLQQAARGAALVCDDQRWPLLDMAAYPLWGMCERVAYGAMPTPRHPIRARLARWRRRRDRRWVWRQINAARASQWIYVIQAKTASWSRQLFPPLQHVLAARPDVGLMVGEEILTGNDPQLDFLGPEVPFPPARIWRIDHYSKLDLPAVAELAQSVGLGDWPINPFTVEIAQTLDYQAVLLQRWLNVLEAAWRVRPPAMVFVNNDVEPQRRATCMVAKARGIPTVNIQHGMLNHGLQNRLAVSDCHLLWGEAFTRILAESGAETTSVCIVGGPQFDALAGIKTAPADHGGATRLLYAAQVPSFEIPLEKSTDILEAHGRLARANPNIEVVLRPHPRETPELRQRSEALAASVPNMRMSKAANVAEAIVDCDVVSTVFSTVSLDAAVQGRATVILDFAGEGQRFPFERKAPFFAADTEESLPDVIQQAAAFSRAANPAQWQQVYDDVFAGLDGGAAARAGDIIGRVLDDQSRNTEE
jgi:hypothetical protein